MYIGFLLLLSVHLFSPAVAEPQFITSQLENNLERDLTIHVVSVNYKQSHIDESELFDGLPVERSWSTTSGLMTWNVDYNLTFATANQVDAIRQVMLDNSANGTGTGTEVNESALEYQKDNWDDLQAAFNPRDGRRIDGYVIEDHLAANPLVTPPGLGFVLYMFNFSEFDSPDHSLEHWYDYYPEDPDTGEEQDWFRLEWDNALNPDLTMDYAGFGGRYNLFVVDPSAHQWYLKWARIWWSDAPYTDAQDYSIMDLEDKVNTLDLESPAGVTALNVYLNSWIRDPINYLFVPYQNSLPPYVENGQLTGLVFAMDVASGTSVESLEWVTNAERQDAALTELMPFLDWTVSIQFLDIDEHPDWRSLFDAYSTVDTHGKTIVDGLNMFYAIDDQMRPEYVDIEDPDIHVFSVVFIKKYMEMRVYGRQYTGLGSSGIQQTVIWKSWERYYRPDEVTPKAGISSVQLHETGHALGFGHSFNQPGATPSGMGEYVADFNFGMMGYFTRHNGTSTFERNWVQSTYLDQMDLDLRSTYNTRIESFTGSERDETLQAQAAFLHAHDMATVYYNMMDWEKSYEWMSAARDWLRRMTYSNSDEDPPVIQGWGIEPYNYSLFGPDEARIWARVSDGVAGLENVTAHVRIGSEEDVYSCENNGTFWTTAVPQAPVDIDVEVWVEAWDWGMNHAESNHKLFEGGELPPTDEDPLILVMIIGGIAALAIIIVCMKKRGT